MQLLLSESRLFLCLLHIQATPADLSRLDNKLVNDKTVSESVKLLAAVDLCTTHVFHRWTIKLGVDRLRTNSWFTGKEKAGKRENRSADARAYETGVNTLPFKASMVVPLQEFTTVPQPRHGMKSKCFRQLTWESVPSLGCTLDALLQNAPSSHSRQRPSLELSAAMVVCDQ